MNLTMNLNEFNGELIMNLQLNLQLNLLGNLTVNLTTNLNEFNGEFNNEYTAAMRGRFAVNLLDLIRSELYSEHNFIFTWYMNLTLIHCFKSYLLKII